MIICPCDLGEDTVHQHSRQGSLDKKKSHSIHVNWWPLASPPRSHRPQKSLPPVTFWLFAYFSQCLIPLIHFSSKSKAMGEQMIFKFYVFIFIFKKWAWMKKHFGPMSLSHKGAVSETECWGTGLYSSRSKLQVEMILSPWKLWKAACSGNLFYEIRYISRNRKALGIGSYCLNLR